MSEYRRSKPGTDAAERSLPEEVREEGSENGPAEGAADGQRERFRARARRRLLGAQSRRLFLQVGLPWGAALLVGLVSVLYADLSTDASNAFTRCIAGHTWLAFFITPALTVLALFLTRRWFTGSEGSGIPFTPPLYEALAENNYFGVATLPPGGFLKTKPVPPPGA